MDVQHSVILMEGENMIKIIESHRRPLSEREYTKIRAELEMMRTELKLFGSIIEILTNYHGYNPDRAKEIIDQAVKSPEFINKVVDLIRDCRLAKAP